MTSPRQCNSCCLRTTKLRCPRCGGETDVDEYKLIDYEYNATLDDFPTDRRIDEAKEDAAFPFQRFGRRDEDEIRGGYNG